MSRTVPVLATLAVLLLAAVPASAHVTKDFGPVTLKVGWADEPAASGSRNHVTLQAWYTDNETGVSGLADTLKVTVKLANQSKDLDMEESDEDPGNYSAPILPTQEGLYVIHVEGAAAGQQVSADFNVEAVDNGADAAFPPAPDLAGQVATLQEKVAALEAKAQTQSTTPATTSPQPTGTPASKGVPAPALGLSLAAVALVALALALRRRS